MSKELANCSRAIVADLTSYEEANGLGSDEVLQFLQDIIPITKDYEYIRAD